jgi:phosphate transport system substrate-binding protein
MKLVNAIWISSIAVVVSGFGLPAYSKDSPSVKPATVAPAGAKPDAFAESSDTAATPATAAPVAVDAKLADFKPKGGISGRLKSVGSDTMNNLMTLWSEDFKVIYPDVQIEIEGKGSGTALPALIQGTADLGPMSRDMTPAETAQFREKFGYDPTQLKTAIDMVAVYVHKDNPIEGLTLEQVDAIFSKARKRGHENDVRTWGELGLKGDWAKKPISLYGRDPASGTYVYFKEHVLEKGDYKDTVKQLAGSSAVVQGVAKDQYGIGYSGIGYKTADVRAVPLAKNAKAGMVPAEAQNAYNGTYPLSRFLSLSLNYKPKAALSPLNSDFLKFVLSKAGQGDVVKAGFLPLPNKVAEASLKSVGLAGEK